jgi:ligand-binding sensor domain-containing protein
MAEARILYIATADGLVQLANPGKSDRWREIGRAMRGQDLRAVVASPNDPLLALAASAAGIARSTNGGMSWDTVWAQPVRSLVFDTSGSIYAGADDGTILRSDDGDWSEIARVATPILRWTLLPGGALLGVGADGLLYERDGERWRSQELQRPDLHNVAVDPGDPAVLLLLSAGSLETPAGSQLLPAPTTGALLMLSGQQPVLLIGTREALLRSEDRGATLLPVAGPSAVTVLVTPPRFIDQAFAGTEQGALWFSADRGRHWAELRAGYAPIRDLAFARAL